LIEVYILGYPVCTFAVAQRLLPRYHHR